MFETSNIITRCPQENIVKLHLTLTLTLTLTPTLTLSLTLNLTVDVHITRATGILQFNVDAAPAGASPI